MSTTDSPDPEKSSSVKATVTLDTIGCKLNHAESELLARRFLESGFGLVTPNENPDVFVLNTCTVTHIADRKCRQALRSFHRKNPDALVIAMGCYVDRNAQEAGQIEGVDLAIGNAEKDRLVETIHSRLHLNHTPGNGNGHHAPIGELRTRSEIKIQDGCSQGCSYCIVPYVRGPERSEPIEAILTEIKARAVEGYKEVVLTGTRIGTFGSKGGLETLLERILGETTIPRIRLSSLQPQELTPSLIELWRSNDRICHHLHLALQSGSSSVLARMQRGYSLDEYMDVVNSVRNAMPDIAITTDVIVGFPGETDEEFEESFRFCEKIGFARMHIFPYSVRARTKAATLPDKVPDKVKKYRTQRMLDLAKQSAQMFHRRFQGVAMPVLWETLKGNKLWVGYTSNYIKVFTKSDQPLCNSLSNTILGEEYEQGLWGQIIAQDSLATSQVKGV
ncbi:MAG: tRNA (N(6)-L-threonylcarbamoyladenosine(37)-C(2))-methylthiotransferase MtaB [Chloroflexi bacterium]|nr:tRNA (N(6)-L-threonylcarbamoyladenosine(37)-C(2))-methylthiotransferase MtaB [Chloroflexota bacterium]